MDHVNKLIAMQTEDIRKERDRLAKELAFQIQVKSAIQESRREIFNRMEAAEQCLKNILWATDERAYEAARAHLEKYGIER
jgi:hypothetical protein